jgi:hypothetical protein
MISRRQTGFDRLSVEKVEARRTGECRRQGAGRELGLLEGAFSYRMVVPTLVKCLFRQPEWSIHYAAAESARIALAGSGGGGSFERKL